MLVEILIGVLVALAIIAGAILFAFKTPNIKGLSRHNIRGNGDYADSQVRGNRGFDSGGDSGGDGGGGD
jgi:hypothetical protein